MNRNEDLPVRPRACEGLRKVIPELCVQEVGEKDDIEEVDGEMDKDGQEAEKGERQQEEKDDIITTSH